MARGAWDRTAQIVATIAECNRDPGTNPRPYRLVDFNPFRVDDEQVIDDGRLRYDPSVFQAIGDDGK